MAPRHKKPDKKRKPKEPFVARIKRRGRETYALGNTLVHNPRAFPAQAGGLLKRSFRTMWDARGGGFYACGFVLTFIWLEVSTLVDEISASDGVISFFTEQFFEFLFRFSVQSIGNTVQAFIWPLLIIERLGPVSIIPMLVVYFLFSRLLKDPLSNWLFADSDAAAPGGVPTNVMASTPNAHGADDDKLT
ncbi:MAG: hypothetical protein KJN72_00780 [Woeseia sp.]|nr:hypothetical protein [Woeseia sp.]